MLLQRQSSYLLTALHSLQAAIDNMGATLDCKSTFVEKEISTNNEFVPPRFCQGSGRRSAGGSGHLIPIRTISRPVRSRMPTKFRGLYYILVEPQAACLLEKTIQKSYRLRERTL
jgi:hypothetical protein